MIDAEVFRKLYISASKVIDYLEGISISKTYRELNHRPVYTLSNGVKVEVIKWLGNRYFCSYCNRIRLSPKGVLKPCVMIEYGVDLKQFLRPTVDLDGLRKAFAEVNQMRIPYNMVLHNRTFITKSMQNS
ncbi:MAG: hypothetical protein QW406_07035, partial [Ignisphaera sp.]